MNFLANPLIKKSTILFKKEIKAKGRSTMHDKKNYSINLGNKRKWEHVSFGWSSISWHCLDIMSCWLVSPRRLVDILTSSTLNMIWNRSLCRYMRLRWGHTGWVLNSITSVHIRRDTDTHGGGHAKMRRVWRGGSTSQAMPRIASNL